MLNPGKMEDTDNLIAQKDAEVCHKSYIAYEWMSSDPFY